MCLWICVPRLCHGCTKVCHGPELHYHQLCMLQYNQHCMLHDYHAVPPALHAPTLQTTMSLAKTRMVQHPTPKLGCELQAYIHMCFHSIWIHCHCWHWYIHTYKHPYIHTSIHTYISVIAGIHEIIVIVYMSEHFLFLRQTPLWNVMVLYWDIGDDAKLPSLCSPKFPLICIACLTCY